jgi:hypothetical protein
MAKPKGTHFVVSAGFTSTGGPAYLEATGSWSQHLADAACFATEDEAKSRAATAAEVDQRTVCDPYAFAVRAEPGGIDPLTAREHIRARGPSVAVRRPD